MASSSQPSRAPDGTVKRIRHRRRASQPAFSFAHSSASNRNYRNNPSIPFANPYSSAVAEAYSNPPATTISSSSTSTSASSSSDEYTSGDDQETEDQDDAIGWNERVKSNDGLEYLDLSLSLPFRLATAKNQMLAYLAELETRVRQVCSTSSTPTPESSLADSSTISPIQLQFNKFNAQVEGFKEDLRKLATLIPTPSTSFPFPLRRPSLGLSFPSSSSIPSLSLMKTGPIVSLAAEWEKIFNTLQLHLPSSPDLHFPPLLLSTLSGMSSKRSDGENLSLRLLENLQARFELLQDSVSGITLRGFLSPQVENHQSRSSSPENDDVRSTPIPISPSLARKLELKFNTFSANAQDAVSQVGLKAKETAKDTEEMLYQAALELAGAAGRGKRALIEYRHLPTIWKNNEHILSGYRFIPSSQWKTLIKSTFEIHNETLNIHTHLWGMLIVAPLFWPSKGLDADTTPMDRLVQTIYLCAAIKCLFLSVSWHIMAGCSDVHVFEKSACLDFVGIAWLIAASIWTLVYNAFYCQPNLAFFYSTTTFLVGLVGAILPWAKWFNKRENKHYRIMIFLSMCFAALAPFTHAVFEHGFLKSFLFFSPILPSLAFYIGGLVFYALQWPEKSYPGRFDLGTNSHVIWHVAIVLAILMHYRAALQFHANRFEFSCASSPPVSGLSSAANKLVSAVGGLHGVEGLMKADEQIHQGRIFLGSLGQGAVGRAWDRMMDWIQTW